jgi:hypothetical protein
MIFFLLLRNAGRRFLEELSVRICMLLVKTPARRYFVPIWTEKYCGWEGRSVRTKPGLVKGGCT